MNKNKDFYETNSLLLATTLLCVGLPLDSISKAKDGKFVFIFPRTPDLDQILESFWQRALKLEPNSFWENQRFLKSRIHGG